MVNDLVLFPHCDLHVSIAHAPQLKLQVFHRTDGTPGGPYSLVPITGSCRFDFLAPDLEVGLRFNELILPTVAADGSVTATTLGRYLFQVRYSIVEENKQVNRYIVGSLQVHADILAWRFGNSSITTALDTQLGHAQPSIYATFSDDGDAGTDLVGDITGHGYVQLTSNDASKVVVMPNDRLRGITEGSTTVAGNFLGPPQDLTVRVVDYAKPGRNLLPVVAPNVAQFAKMHNVVFLAEGFRTNDEARFTYLVTQTVERLFEAPRHQPFAMLERRFNNFKVFSGSTEHAVTVGYRITEQVPGSLRAGLPIPWEKSLNPAASIYAPSVLVAKVGLPRRGEARSRSALITEWRDKKRITTDDESHIDETLITVWKAQQSQGILDARDTIFGMILGSRPGDRQSALGVRPAARPAADNNTTASNAFVDRVYEFYSFPPARTCSCDPRRHPPEVYAGPVEINPLTSIMRFLAAQSYAHHPFQAIGPEWTPDPATYKRSRGLVALVANDVVDGGSNINARTIAAQTIAREDIVDFDRDSTGPVTAWQRKLPANYPDPDPALEPEVLVNKVAHEFGHSFALDDEYEGADVDAPQAQSETYDNVTYLGTIRDGAGTRSIDPAKVKWLVLPRMALCARLLGDSFAQPAGIDVRIDPRFVAGWKHAMTTGKEVVLRRADIGPRAIQLPLGTGPIHLLTNLRVTGLDETTGVLRLNGPSVPAIPPTFTAGSLVYVPKVDGALARTVGHRQVIDFIADKKIPLNVNTDHDKSNDKFDNPKTIPGLNPPCVTSRLIGVYEGAAGFAGAAYRPAGQCKMRSSQAVPEPEKGDGEFCFVCKWLIVNNVDPGMHALLDKLFYPGAKKKKKDP